MTNSYDPHLETTLLQSRQNRIISDYGSESHDSVIQMQIRFSTAYSTQTQSWLYRWQTKITNIIMVIIQDSDSSEDIKKKCPLSLINNLLEQIKIRFSISCNATDMTYSYYMIY